MPVRYEKEYYHKNGDRVPVAILLRRLPNILLAIVYVRLLPSRI